MRLLSEDDRQACMSCSIGVLEICWQSSAAQQKWTGRHEVDVEMEVEYCMQLRSLQRKRALPMFLPIGAVPVVTR